MISAAKTKFINFWGCGDDFLCHHILLLSPTALINPADCVLKLKLNAENIYIFIFTWYLTLVTQPLSLQSTVSGTSAPDAPAKGDGALWMSVGGLSVAKDCRISSGVCEEVNNKWWNEQDLFSRLSSPKVTSANAFYLCKHQSKTQRFRTFSSPLYYIPYILISQLIFLIFVDTFPVR